MRLLAPEFIEAAISVHHGYHRLDPWLLEEQVVSSVELLDRPAAWQEAILHWLTLLQEDLGGAYYLLALPGATLLSDRPHAEARWLTERVLELASGIREILGPAANPGFAGGVMMIAFTELDDYDPYVTHHFPDGEQAATGGVFLDLPVPHIAFPWPSSGQVNRVLGHELAHHCVAHLSLPLWLNEGVAQLVEKRLADGSGGPFETAAPALDHERAERHRACWTRDSIQAFWAGITFHVPGDSSELSYSLAEILVTLILQCRDGGAFTEFLRTATPEDAGQAAAWDTLELDLGEVAATFLGPGNWRPQRKAIRTLQQTDPPGFPAPAGLPPPRVPR
ncbi:MAG: hypothetical protein J0L84_13690 [Verrucomicrobia bacterium]|nr:hypothetical protein [Verrucomicrobiota bacterium]